MTITTEEVIALMTRCRVGVGGIYATDDPRTILSDCYRMIGALVAERDALLQNTGATRNKDIDLLITRCAIGISVDATRHDVNDLLRACAKTMRELFIERNSLRQHEYICKKCFCAKIPNRGRYEF